MLYLFYLILESIKILLIMRLESYSFKTTKCDIKNYKHQKIKYKILLLTSLWDNSPQQKLF